MKSTRGGSRVGAGTLVVSGLFVIWLLWTALHWASIWVHG